MEAAYQHATFPQFMKLPPELRDQIWCYTFPEPRVYEVLDSPVITKSPGQSRQSRQSSGALGKLAFADSRNEPPPILARVCRDAHAAVLRHYKPIVFSGTVKHLDLSRDVFLLDAYLQVRRLIKVVRLLSQVESVKTKVTRLALGTSFGMYTGLNLRLFHKKVQTKKNMAKLLDVLARFRRLETIVLVVYQQSAFSVRLSWPVHQAQQQAGTVYDLQQRFQANLESVNFNFDNYYLRRSCDSRLVEYDPPAAEKVETAQAKLHHYEPQQLRSSQVRELKATFEGCMAQLVADGSLGDAEPPTVEAATLTWIYTSALSGSLR